MCLLRYTGPEEARNSQGRTCRYEGGDCAVKEGGVKQVWVEVYALYATFMQEDLVQRIEWSGIPPMVG